MQEINSKLVHYSPFYAEKTVFFKAINANQKAIAYTN